MILFPLTLPATLVFIFGQVALSNQLCLCVTTLVLAVIGAHHHLMCVVALQLFIYEFVQCWLFVISCLFKHSNRAIYEHQIAIAYLAIKEPQITSNYLATKECQMVSVHLAMLVTSC
jgi:hypothetical protein